MNGQPDIDELVKHGLEHIRIMKPLIYKFETAWTVFMIRTEAMSSEIATVAYEKLMEEVCPYRVEINQYVSHEKLRDFIYKHGRSGAMYGLHNIGKKTSYVYFSDIVDATFYRLSH